MTTDIKGLVKRLRDGDCLDIGDAADALEAMAGENERLNALIGPALEAAVSPLRKYIGELQELNKAAEAERDRLKAALERIAWMPKSEEPWARNIALKALGGDES